MNRYETTLTLTVSLKAEDEAQARKLLNQVENRLLQRNMSALTRITYVQGGDEFDCMEVDIDG